MKSLGMQTVWVMILVASHLISWSQRTERVSLFYGIDLTEPIGGYDPLKATLNQKGIQQIHVVGFADCLGDTLYNRDLSGRRAAAVKSWIEDYLLDLGSAPVTFQAKGEQPCATAGNQGDPQQRRVMVYVEFTVDEVEQVKVIHPLMREPDPVDHPVKEETPIPIPEAVLPTESGTTIALAGVNFYGGRHVVLPSALPVLDALCMQLLSSPSAQIELIGHICCSDPESDGLDLDTGEYALSVNRAKAVYDYLISKGISAERLSYRGLGCSQPLVWPEWTEEDRTRNRRVEVKLISE
jgi:outer membrane protein OmpA-like peptidoglycan-associated protein